MKTITKTTFDALNTALIERLEIKRLEAQLDERKKANNETLLKLSSQLATENEKTVAPGLTIAVNTEVTIGDAGKAMEWINANPFLTGGLVRVRKEATATLRGFLLQLDKIQTALTTLFETATVETKETIEPALNVMKAVNLSNVFELDDNAYKSAVRSGDYLDIPYAAKQEVEQVRITEKAVKTGAELEVTFTIVDEVENADQTVS